MENYREPIWSLSDEILAVFDKRHSYANIRITYLYNYGRAAL